MPSALGVLGLLVAAAAGPAAHAAPRVVTERVSISPVGQPNDISGRFSRPALSSSGAHVVFDSVARNLVAADRNDSADVFLRDRAARSLERVSVSTAGREGDDDSSDPAVSGDGRYVVFESDAANLAPRDTNDESDVLLRDRVRRTTTLLSRGRDGASGDDSSFSPFITASGRYVVFLSDARNLVAPAPPPFTRNAYLWDRDSGRVQLVSRGADGRPVSDAASPSISANGRYLAFAAFSDAVVPGDTNSAFDVFVRDRWTQTTRRVSLSTDGQQGDAASTRPVISADGRLVAYASEATNLVPGDTNGVQDVFVTDLRTGATTRVSVSSAGAEADGQSIGPGIRGGQAFGPDLSADGRRVTFDSVATNLVDGDTNTCSYQGGPQFLEPGECPDVYLRDLSTSTTSRLSLTRQGAQVDDASTDPAISADGTAVAFFSTGSLVPTDTNTCPPFFLDRPGRCPDIYLRGP